MQKNKLLFLCPDTFGLYKVFEKGLQNYSNMEVQTYICREYRYAHIGEKILNFFSKTFLKKNLKKKWNDDYQKTLFATMHYDCVFVICPEVYSINVLQQIVKKVQHSIVYFWDGFDHFPQYKMIAPLFSNCFTFDPKDAKKYRLHFLPNFYFYEDRNASPKIDLFFLASFDTRYPLIENIVNTLKANQLSVKVYLYSKKNKHVKKIKSNKNITFIDTYIPFEETMTLMKESKIILDIHKKIQTGLSFRVFEAMGLGKKLITTNKDIVNYDFYNPNNIFIWDESVTIIPESFTDTPYQELDEAIYKKYSIENWIQTVLASTY